MHSIPVSWFLDLNQFNVGYTVSVLWVPESKVTWGSEINTPLPPEMEVWAPAHGYFCKCKRCEGARK